MCPPSATLTSMITGSLKNQVDKIWDTFWAGGIANPITVVEQFTYLLFLKHLDKNRTRSIDGEPLEQRTTSPPTSSLKKLQKKGYRCAGMSLSL